MKAQEFTAKRRQTIRLLDDSEFVIRRVGIVDILVAGGNPNLLVFLQKNGRSAKSVKEFAEEVQVMFERVKENTAKQRKFCEGLILRGIVEPKIGGDDGVDLADLTFEECDLLAGGILKFAGFTKEAAEAVAPLPKTGSLSKTLTLAPGDTDAPPPTSSEQPASKPIPSTLPACEQASIGSEKKSSE